MTSPRLIALGVSLRPLEPVSAIGELLGVSRATAFRMASAWPTTGGHGEHRRVIVTRLLDELGIPYELRSEEESHGH